MAGLIAWQGLFRHGKLKEGQSVLIHGGSGGVGHFAIQFAKASGARALRYTVEADGDELAEIAADVLASVEKGHSVGKVVLKVA